MLALMHSVLNSILYILYINKHVVLHSATDIYIFAIGDDIFDDDLMPLTAGTGGTHYFRVKDLEKLQDTFDEMISKLCLK